MEDKTSCNYNGNISCESKKTLMERNKSPDLFEEDELLSVNTDTKPFFSVIKSDDVTAYSVMDLTECVNNTTQSKECFNSSASFDERKVTDHFHLLNGKNKKDHFECMSNTNKKFESVPKIFTCIQTDEAKQPIVSINTDDSILSTTQHMESKTNSSSETVSRSNDFMEVTTCVVSKFDQKTIEKIDLTQDDNEQVLIDIPNKTKDMVKDHVCVDVEAPAFLSSPVHLNYNSNFMQDEIERKDTKYNAPMLMQKLVENIDLTQYSENKNIKLRDDDDDDSEAVDLTQSSNSNEDFPIVQLKGIQNEINNKVSNDNEKNEDNSNTKMKKNKVYIEEYRSPVKKPSENIIIINEDEGHCNTITENCSAFQIHSNENIGEDNEKDSLDNSDVTEINSDAENNDVTKTISFALCHQNNFSPNNQLDVSVDYDELYDKIMSNENSIKSDTENANKSQNVLNKECAIIDDKVILDDNTKNFNNINTTAINIEKNKGVFVYRSIMNELSNVEILNIDPILEYNYSLPVIEDKNNDCVKSQKDACEVTPIKVASENKIVKTPTTNEYIIKTNNVTPIMDFESMSSPVRNKELEKYGIKPVKRKRAIQLLTYIYNQTHPVIEQCNSMPSSSKKAKMDVQNADFISGKFESIEESRVEMEENQIYKETKENPDLKDIECNQNEWVFQTREKAKVHSCRVPLHVAFHNYVSCRNLLRAAILAYEPINIDIVHKGLVANGYRYNPKDLLKFMDRKCITVRTTEGNSRNRKKKYYNN